MYHLTHENYAFICARADNYARLAGDPANAHDPIFVARMRDNEAGLRAILADIDRDTRQFIQAQSGGAA